MTDKKITFSVEGMSCAACSQAVENTLADTDGISEASVNINTEKATISYNPESIGFVDLEEIVDKSGYKLKKRKVELPIAGMSCSSCAQAIEKKYC